MVSFQPRHHRCVRRGCQLIQPFPDSDVVLAHSFNPDGGRFTKSELYLAHNKSVYIKGHSWNFSGIDILVVSDRGYRYLSGQMLMAPWKNIVPTYVMTDWRSALQIKCIVCAIFNCAPWKSTLWICSGDQFKSWTIQNFDLGL